MNENMFLFYNSPVIESFQTTELIHIYFSSFDLGKKRNPYSIFYKQDFAFLNPLSIIPNVYV